MKTIFEYSKPGRTSCHVPAPHNETKAWSYIPEQYRRKTELGLPQVSENEVVRHFIALSDKNFHVDKALYPLGSCTMKYNPKVNEVAARMPGFTKLHPITPYEHSTGAMKLIHELSNMLCEVTGMDAITMQPSAGAHGEFTAMLMIHAYHKSKGNPRSKVLIPDSAHGTNPASVVMAGYKSVKIPSNSVGEIDIEGLKANLDSEVAAIMITNPNTLGVFETNIKQIADLIHGVGALMYMDGANLNAMVGLARPGDMGFDVTHLNLHKTFSTPHGGGGPGSGPVAIKKELEPFLPLPVLQKSAEGFYWDWNRPQSIGKMMAYFGNFMIMVRAYVYLRMLGKENIRKVSETAVLNANYMRKRVTEVYDLCFDVPHMHEFVLNGKNLKKYEIKAIDVAKRLLDKGFHAPTMYFPISVPDAIMIEPTETESKDSLDAFADALLEIIKEAEANPETLTNAPITTPVRRLDEGFAARKLFITWPPPEEL